MERRQLGSSGLAVPVIGLGTWRVFNVKDDAGEARCEAVVDAALEAGANLFDSSPMYGDAERVLATALSSRREQAIVATKVLARTRAVGETQVERVLGWFEHIDVYFVHNLLAHRDHLPFLRQLADRGLIGALGGSHYLPSSYPDLCELVRAGNLQVLEVPYHPGAREAAEELLPEAERHGVGVIAMRPFAGGALLRDPPGDDELAPLADFGVRTWPQAILKWILSDPRVHAAIPATSSPDHMVENAAAGAPPWFGTEERAYVRELTERRRG